MSVLLVILFVLLPILLGLPRTRDAVCVFIRTRLA
jgi:hypothetical protein